MVVVVEPDVNVRFALLVDVLELDATVAVTVALPVPLPDERVIQLAEDGFVRVHPTDSLSVMVKVKVEPDADTVETVVGLIDPSAAASPACVTVNVFDPPE